MKVVLPIFFAVLSTATLSGQTYVGREPDAPWRKAALERIEALRKDDFTITVKDAKGQPLSDQAITVELWRHEFQFGANVPAAFLASDSSTDARRYREMVDRLFSGVVFGNELNHALWQEQGKRGRHPSTLAAMKWALEQQLPLRGHNLFLVAVNDRRL